MTEEGVNGVATVDDRQDGTGHNYQESADDCAQTYSPTPEGDLEDDATVEKEVAVARTDDAAQGSPAPAGNAEDEVERTVEAARPNDVAEGSPTPEGVSEDETREADNQVADPGPNEMALEADNQVADTGPNEMALEVDN